MTTTFYDETIPKAVACLQGLSNVLAKASAKEESLSNMLQVRLYPDMLPLSFQVYFVCDFAAKMVARVCGTEVTPMGSHTDYKTYDDCKKYIEKAREVLKSADKDVYNSRLEEIVEFGLGRGKTGRLSAKAYVDSMAIPNIFFHVVTTYGILRKEGVDLTKGDYLNPFGITKAEVIEH